jgi:hypothetical protein
MLQVVGNRVTDDWVAVPAMWIVQRPTSTEVKSVVSFPVENKPRIPNPLVNKLEQNNLL